MFNGIIFNTGKLHTIKKLNKSILIELIQIENLKKRYWFINKL